MIHIAELTRTYGSFWRRAPVVQALDGVSLSLAPGSALGLIGLNGAGKTTLLKMLLGYVRPTSGELTISGLPPRAYVEQNGIGYVPEHVAIPRHWTVESALHAFALLGNAGHDGPERVSATLHRLGIEDLRKRGVGHLSKGNLQRVAIAQALLCDRDILVLDEPTDGLDPLWIAELRSILAEWRARDPQRILIIASHNLPEIERIADRVAVLHAGRIIADLPMVAGKQGRPLEELFLELIQEPAGAA